MKRFDTHQLTLCAVVAALYAVLSYFAGIFGIAYGPIQCRLSEALCVLPFFFPGTTWGLFIGCLVANLLSPYGAPDIILGSLATLLAAAVTARVKFKWLAPLPPVIANGVLVGGLLAWYQTGFGPGFGAAYLYNGATVALGELLACYILGGILLQVIPRIPYFRSLMAKERLA